jgi:HlyD family secretion protein
MSEYARPNALSQHRRSPARLSAEGGKRPCLSGHRWVEVAIPLRLRTARRFLSHGPLLLLGVVLSGGCTDTGENSFQGYVEGEFVYVASPLGGRLETLSVRRGQTVKVGDPLFQLEKDSEKAAVQEALERLRQAQNRLADLQKGKRPSEIAALEARLKEAEAALQLSEETLRRREKLYREGSIAMEDLDRARTTQERDGARVREARADLATARLGGRADEVLAAKAEAQAVAARVEQARWNLDQKVQVSPRQGLVFDTLFRVGEWVPAGRPAVVLLPPENIKVRFFVPEKVVGSVAVGERVFVSFDSSGTLIQAAVTYISPEAEYTPPVIYSSQSRAKLVFMVEARPDPAAADRLHPGQPVDVRRARQGKAHGAS